MSIKLNIKDKYHTLCPREIINCFEKPIGIVLDYHNELNSSYFFIYKKIVQSYRLRSHVYDEHNFILKYLGLNYYVLQDVSDIKITLKKYIEKKIPVLVTGDVIELYYSNFFKRQNHSHLFLVIGYDDRDLYNIIDANPWYDYTGQQYIDQVIESLTLNKVYDASEKKQLIIIQSISNTKEFNNEDLILYLLDLYLNHTYSYPFIEEAIINNINNNISDKKYNYNDDLYELVNKPKIKRFLLQEIDYIINKVFDNEFDSATFLNVIDRYYDSCKDLINIIISQIYRGEYIVKDQLVDSIIGFEEKIRLMLKIFQEKVYQMHLCKFDSNKEFNNDYMKFENNEDGIISYLGDDYLFNFNSNKIYNSWDKDINPKVILMNGLSTYPSFYFQTSVDIDKNYEEIGFLAGITFYTNDNIYSWGIHSGASIVLDNMGVDTNLLQINYKTLSVTLFIEMKNYHLSIGYIDSNGNKVIRGISTNGQVCKICIGCKTWVNGKRLKIKFSNNIIRLC